MNVRKIEKNVDAQSMNELRFYEWTEMQPAVLDNIIAES